MPIWPIWPSFEVNGLDWQCCLAGSSKRAPRILIFSIGMGAESLFYLKSIATFAPTFYGYIISLLASVTISKKVTLSNRPIKTIDPCTTNGYQWLNTDALNKPLIHTRIRRTKILNWIVNVRLICSIIYIPTLLLAAGRVCIKGQLISKANSKLSFETKTNENNFVFLPKPLKLVESRKYKINIC